MTSFELWRYALDETTSVEGASMPARIALGVPYPNPVVGRVVIPFTLEFAGETRLEIVDVLGRQVATVASGFYAAGTQEAEFDSSALAPGMYVIRLIGMGETAARAFTVAR